MSDDFTSLAELQAAHADLIRRIDLLDREAQTHVRDVALEQVEVDLAVGPAAPATEGSATRTAELLGQVEAIEAEAAEFEARAIACGKILDELPEREFAQAMLNSFALRRAYVTRNRIALLELSGVEMDEPEADDHDDGPKLAPFDDAGLPSLPDESNPFVGLRAFTADEARQSIFQGREEAVRELVARLGEKRLLLVTGRSGCGKSSLVMAGLLHALEQGALPDSATWKLDCVVMPGSDPIGNLLQAIRPASEDARLWRKRHEKALRAKPENFGDLVAEAIGPEQTAVLVVDQLEELFFGPSQKDREAFLIAVLSLIEGEAPAHRVVLIYRKDYEARLMALPALAGLAAEDRASFEPRPMTGPELTQAILGPASAKGLKFDPGLIEALVRDVIADPAALPLLQFTLAQLWGERRRNRITWEAYEKVGPPGQALGRIAQQVYDSLHSVENKEAAKLIFLALIAPGTVDLENRAVGREYVRRRVRREALHQLADPSRIDDVLRRFTSANLIRKTPGEDRSGDSFDVMHEALIRNWPQVRKWIDELAERDEERLLVLNEARGWDRHGRSDDHLAIGGALDNAARFTSDPLIAAYVTASRNAQKARYEDERKRANRYRGILVAMVTGAVVLGLIGLSAGWRIGLRKSEENQVVAVRSAQKAGAAAVVARSSAEQVGMVLEKTALFAGDTATPVEPPVAQRPAGGVGREGFIWIGSAKLPLLRQPERGSPVSPKDVAGQRSYRARVDLQLYNAPPDAKAYDREVPASGTVPAGALVDAAAAPLPYSRVGGDQFWLKIRLAPRVYLQSTEAAAEPARELVARLVGEGYDAPAAELISSAKGLAEVRWFHDQDREPAEALATKLSDMLGRQIRTVQISRLRDRADPGTLEVWVDLTPGSARG